MQNAKKVRTLPFTNMHSILQAFHQIFFESSLLLLFLAISFLVILCLLSVRPRTVRMYHHLHTYLYYLFRGRHLLPRLRRFQIRPGCFLQRFAYFPCQISFCHGIYLFRANFFLPTGESDDFLSAANGLK